MSPSVARVQFWGASFASLPLSCTLLLPAPNELSDPALQCRSFLGLGCQWQARREGYLKAMLAFPSRKIPCRSITSRVSLIVVVFWAAHLELFHHLSPCTIIQIFFPLNVGEGYRMSLLASEQARPLQRYKYPQPRPTQG